MNSKKIIILKKDVQVFVNLIHKEKFYDNPPILIRNLKFSKTFIQAV